MCVEYLEKHLVDEEAIFEIPELEVRQWSQNIDPSSKLQMLLESQNEVTKVTFDVAKHLADIAPGDKEGKNGNNLEVDRSPKLKLTPEVPRDKLDVAKMKLMELSCRRLFLTQEHCHPNLLQAFWNLLNRIKQLEVQFHHSYVNVRNLGPFVEFVKF